MTSNTPLSGIIDRKLEDPQILVDLESILKNRRGYVFKPPVSDEGIVFIVSGGLDSTIALFKCLNELDNNIYPLYIQRKARAEDSEMGSVRHYIDVFSKQFDKLKPLEIISAEIPPSSIKDGISKKILNTLGHPMRNAILQSYAVQYAVSISVRNNNAIKTIFTATSPDDTFPHSSITALRSLTILTCLDAGDWHWQITSPLIEDGLWGNVTKAETIRYAADNKIDLSMTHSCTQKIKPSCGKCPECRARIKAFNKAGINDPVEYIGDNNNED